MDTINRRTAIGCTVAGTLAALARPHALAAQVPSLAPAQSQARGFTVEYYYKVRWGAFDEFRRLYIKNHLPILRRYQARGYILAMSVTLPITHAGEASRWDMRFDITWRDAATAFDEIADEEAIIRELYPDQATFRREEQRRFELLEEHMDLPVARPDLSTW